MGWRAVILSMADKVQEALGALRRLCHPADYWSLFVEPPVFTAIAVEDAIVGDNRPSDRCRPLSSALWHMAASRSPLEVCADSDRIASKLSSASFFSWP